MPRPCTLHALKTDELAHQRHSAASRGPLLPWKGHTAMPRCPSGQHAAQLLTGASSLRPEPPSSYNPLPSCNPRPSSCNPPVGCNTIGGGGRTNGRGASTVGTTSRGSARAARVWRGVQPPERALSYGCSPFQMPAAFAVGGPRPRRAAQSKERLSREVTRFSPQQSSRLLDSEFLVSCAPQSSATGWEGHDARAAGL